MVIRPLDLRNCSNGAQWMYRQHIINSCQALKARTSQFPEIHCPLGITFHPKTSSMVKRGENHLVPCQCCWVDGFVLVVPNWLCCWLRGSCCVVLASPVSGSHETDINIYQLVYIFSIASFSSKSSGTHCTC